mmetsp:Transcript_938/g.1205  ORF Transcript_938/g.1205 Transcript_938/m.1205 type:complete len:108 (+) Transcript_938:179-502(+)
MSHIKHRTDFQLTSEINCYVRKVMMKERQRDMKRKNVLHEREMRRVAMNSKRPSTAQAVMRSMEVKTPKDSGGKKKYEEAEYRGGPQIHEGEDGQKKFEDNSWNWRK